MNHLDGKVMCGHTARGFSGETFTCDRRDGHDGLHAEHVRLRDGYVSETEWGSDGLAPHATSEGRSA